MKTFSDFFGFLDDPFKRTPDIDFFFPATKHKEALSLLNYLISSDESYAVITGDVGSGKTITIRKFISMLPANVVPAFIIFTSLSPRELLISIVEAFGIDVDDTLNKQELYSKLTQFFLKIESEGKKPLIIFDEAQNLVTDALHEIRTLSNIQTAKGCVVKTVLVGTNELRTRLDDEELSALKQRIVLNMVLENIDRSEIKDYITFHFVRAGRPAVAIQSRVINRVAKITQGNPRLINIIMERAVIAAFLDNSHSITGYHLTSALSSINTIATNIRRSKDRNVGSKVLSVLVACSVLFASYFVYDYYRNGKDVIIANNVLVKDLPDIVEQVVEDNETFEELIDSTDTNDNGSSGNILAGIIIPPPEPTPIKVVEPVKPPVVEPKRVVIENPPMPVDSNVVVLSATLNVRDEPLVESERVGLVTKGDIFRVNVEQDYWVQVTLPDGRDGWLFKKYLRAAD